jgi:hypothetical protein
MNGDNLEQKTDDFSSRLLKIEQNMLVNQADSKRLMLNHYVKNKAANIGATVLSSLSTAYLGYNAVASALDGRKGYAILYGVLTAAIGALTGFGIYNAGSIDNDIRSVKSELNSILENPLYKSIADSKLEKC